MLPQFLFVWCTGVPQRPDMAAAAGLHSFVAQRGHEQPAGVVFAGQIISN